MASCEFACGIENVRGTITKTTKGRGENQETVRVVAKVTCSGKQKVYIQKIRPRTTKLSANEIRARAVFAEVTKEARTISNEERAAYEKEWRKNGRKFNGKKYGTLRGYICARLFADRKKDN